MLSFKQYISEKADPLKVLKRLDKNKGIEGEDQEEYETPKDSPLPWKVQQIDVKTRNIPLKGYDEKESEDVYDSYDDKTWGKNLKLKRKSFNIKELKPLQPTVRIDDLYRFKTKLDNPDNTSVHIVTHKGKNYIMNGHHTIFAARLRGDKEINAIHTNLDEL